MTQAGTKDAIRTIHDVVSIVTSELLNKTQPFDLYQYVGKEILVALKNGTVFRGTVEYNTYEYWQTFYKLMKIRDFRKPKLVYVFPRTGQWILDEQNSIIAIEEAPNENL